MLTTQRNPDKYGQTRPGAGPSTDQCRIYVVDDDPAIANLLFHNLSSSGYCVKQFASSGEMLDSLEGDGPDLVVLDIMMPGPNGLEVARHLRQLGQIPILMLTVRGEMDTKLAALDLGADDYLTKPFEVSELLARVRAILRRTMAPAHVIPLTQYHSGDLSIDLEATRVTLQNRPVRLTGREWAVLKVLVQHAGEVVAPRRVLQQAWGPEYGDEGDYVRTYITRLRRKLELDPSRPAYITLERGKGYRLAAPE